MTDPDEPDVIGATFDQLEEAMTELGADPALVVMELGTKGEFWASRVVQASEALLTGIRRLQPQQTLALTIGGYEDDPRELPDLPEVAKFLRRVMKHAGIGSPNHPMVRMLNEETLALLLQCGVFGRDHPWTVQRVAERTEGMAMRRHTEKGSGR